MLLFPFFFSVTLCVLAAIIFMTRRNQDLVHRWLSALIIITVIFQCTVFFIMSTERLTDFWYIFRMGCPIYYLTPPLVYLYVNFILKKKRKSFKHYAAHFIPFAISIIDIGWYYVNTSSAYRISEVSTIQKLPVAELYLGAGLLPSIIHYYARFIQRAYYIIRQWIVLTKRHTGIKSNSPELNWGLLLTSAQTLILVGYGYFAIQILLFTEFNSSNVFTSSKQVSISFVLLGVISICLYLFTHPEILYGSFWLGPKPVSKPKVKSIEPGQYEWLPTGADITDYCNQLEHYMQAKKPFLKQRISLSYIANETGITPHLLSNILNKHYGKNFSDFNNEYRINHILNRIKLDANWDQFTMEGIALEAGFSSRTSFYAAFKKLTGKSPGIYLTEQAALNSINRDHVLKPAQLE